MKTPYKNIYLVLKGNRILTLVCISIAFLTNIFFGCMAFSIYQKSLHSAFAIGTDGAVIPLQLLTQKENFKVEALSHLELFHQYFYHIDASNFEKNLERALWLGNSSVDNLYRQKKADGVYNRLLQYSLVQRILKIDSEVREINGKYSFTTTTVIEINRGSVTDTYQMETSGNLMLVERNFPHNPHGLLITDFFENSLKKLENEN